MKKYLFEGAFTLVLLLLGTRTVRADFIFNVSVNTSGLSNDSSLSGPLGIDFELISGGSATTHTATISDFNFGSGGSANGSPSSLGGNVIGSLASTVTLTANSVSFFNDFNQGFTPGSTLSFQVDLTTNVGTPTPDSFAFYILQGYSPNSGIPIPTTDNLASSLVSVDITSSDLTVQAFGGTNGDPPSPDVTPVTSPVPEPTTLPLFALGLATLAAGRGWQRRRGTKVRSS
jgi:hypothetical protein